jgi:hypothetical protein
MEFVRLAQDVWVGDVLFYAGAVFVVIPVDVI